MRNVTISLDEETARWARIEAARRDTSVSRLVADLLREYMRVERGYDEAMGEFLARAARPLKSRRAHYPNRVALHDRAGLR